LNCFTPVAKNWKKNEAKINEELIGTQENHKVGGYYQPDAN
jgi:monomeric isocitrate dehydrogenase